MKFKVLEESKISDKYIDLYDDFYDEPSKYHKQPYSKNDSRGVYFKDDRWRNKNRVELVSDSTDEYSDLDKSNNRHKINKNNILRKYSAKIIFKDDSYTNDIVEAVDSFDAEYKLEKKYGSNTIIRDIQEIKNENYIFEDRTPGLNQAKSWKSIYDDQKKKSKQKGISMLQGKWAAGSSSILPNPASGIKMFNHITGADAYSDAGEASSDGSSSISGDASVSSGGMGENYYRRRVREEYLSAPVKGRHIYQVYGEYGGTFTKYADAIKCAKYASTTDEYDHEAKIWVDGLTWYDRFVDGKLVKD